MTGLKPWTCGIGATTLPTESQFAHSIPFKTFAVIYLKTLVRSIFTIIHCFCSFGEKRGSGGGAVGRAVASDTRDLGYKSGHRQNLFATKNIKKTK